MQVERHRKLVVLRDVERVHAGDRVIVEVEREDTEQHHHAADQRIQEELDGRVQTAIAAPDADEEVHRDEHHFPEQEEQQEVERHEGAEHPRLQHEQEDVELLHTIGNRGPRGQHGDRSHHRRQQNQQDAEAVDAEEVFRPDRGNPRRALDELKIGARRVVPEPERNRDDEPDERGDVGDPPDGVLVALVDEQQHERAHQRLEENQREIVIHRRFRRYLRSILIERTNRYSRTRKSRTASAARSSAPDPSGTAGTTGCPPARSSR